VSPDKKISLKEFDNIRSLSLMDIKTLTKFVTKLNNDFESLKTNLRQKLNILSETVDEIKGLASAMLVQPETGGLNKYINFTNLDDIDMSLTSAYIDTVAKNATLSKSAHTPVSDAVFKILPRCTTSGFISIVNNDIANLYDTNPLSLWNYTVKMNSGYIGYVEIVLDITLTNNFDINHLSLNLSDGNLQHSYNYSLYTLVDGQMVPLIEDQTATDTLEVSFNPIRTDRFFLYLRNSTPIINKDSLDYLFFGNNLSFGLVSYHDISWITLKSVEKMGINGIAIDVQGVIPADTSFMIDIETDQGILPAKNNEPVILNEMVKNDIDEMGVDLTVVHPYNNGINVFFTWKSETYPEMILDKTKILRNLNNFDGLSCWIYIPSDTTIDFSSFPGTFDKSEASFPMNISEGIYKYTAKTEELSMIAKQYFLSNSIKFGSSISRIISGERQFIEADAHSDFAAIVSTDDGYRLVAKKISLDEKALFIKRRLESSEYRYIKPRIKLIGTAYSTPIIKTIRIKVS
jgi:hypothetical protein